jgi:hypothetical protein
MKVTFKKVLLISGISLLSGCVMDQANNFDATPHVQAFSNHISNATQSLGESSDRIGGHVQNMMNAASNHAPISAQAKVSNNSFSRDSIDGNTQNVLNASSNNNSLNPQAKVSVKHGSHSFSSELNTDKNNFHSNTSFSSHGYAASMQGGHHESRDGSSQSKVSSSMSVPSMNGGEGQTTISSHADIGQSKNGAISAVAGASGSGLN